MGGRLNVLLTENRPHAPEHWTSQLPRLLRPQGVDAFLARSTDEALELAGQRRMHAAVIDLATPAPEGRPGVTPAPTDRHDDVRRRAGASGRRARPTAPGNVAGGIWLTELFKRLPAGPAVVIINSPAYTDKQLERLLHEALRLGAFSVMNKPVQLEQLLVVFQRLLQRRYAGVWPEPLPGSADHGGTSPH